MKNQRQIVFEILSQNKYSNIELQKYSNHPHRAFITHLVYAVYQNYELLVHQTKDFLKKPVIKEIEIIFAMAAAQHYLMDSVTDYAIVDESVKLAKKVNPKFGGLVNAVLKKMILRPLQLSQTHDELVNLSINTSHPLWIVKLLDAQYGKEETKKILEHHQNEAPLDIRYNPLKISEDQLLDTYPIVKDDMYLIAKSEIFKTDALESGLIVLQDRNSQQLINQITFTSNESVLDACCAPGTKLSQLALKYADRKVIGVDLHEHRIELTQNLINRWNLNNVDLYVSDFLDFNSNLNFDLILCDVPCSGLGVLRRKPDIKHRIQPEDLDQLQLIQEQILNHAASLLSENGVLVYATCTLNKKENEKQIEKFLKLNPNFECIYQETILGYINNGDSFYSAHLVRKSGIIS